MSALRAALRLSYAAVAWSLIAGAASVVIGVRASSTALIGTGTDILADLLSSVVLIWRFRAELHGGHPSHVVERRAHLAAAAALVIVAIGIALTAVVRLIAGEGASPDAAAIAAASTSVVVLALFAVAKYRIAPSVPSAALRMDGHITVVGAVMALLSLVGLALTSAFGWSFADPVAALVIALVAAETGISGLRSA